MCYNEIEKEDIFKVASGITTIFVFSGIVKAIVYYSIFGINIIDYAEWNEYLFFFLNDIVDLTIMLFLIFAAWWNVRLLNEDSYKKLFPVARKVILFGIPIIAYLLFVVIFTNIARKVLLTGSLQSLANIYHYSSTSKPRKYKKQNGFIPIDLVGTWVNTKVDSLSSNHSLSEIFKPVSGFTIKNDSAGNRKIVILYYGEQFAKWAFDSIYINADSILGQINGENKFIGMLNKDEIHISQLSLIDYSVYYDSSFNQKAPKTEFKKISSCSADCMFEQFIIEKTFNLFPIDIEYNSKKFNLTTARKNCDCNQTLFGFPYYTSYQIVNYKIDTSKNSVLRLALFNSQENRNDFFDLTISKTRNLLIKVD